MKLNNLEIVLTKVALQEFKNNLEGRLLDSYTIEERHYLFLQIKACDQMLNRIDSEKKRIMNKKIRFEENGLDVEIQTWRDAKGEVSGFFEFYDLKTGGEDIHAEGGLWFEEDQGGLILSDYDGVFELPKLILQKLHDEFDVNVTDHLDI